MKQYEELSGGVQIQPYDLAFLSLSAREGIMQLASFVANGNRFVIISGLEIKGNVLTDGVILYDNEPVQVVGIADLTGKNTNSIYISIYTRSTLPKKVFGGDGKMTQEPYVNTYGAATFSAIGLGMSLSKIKRVDNVLAQLLSTQLANYFASNAAVQAKQDKMNTFTISPMYNTPFHGVLNSPLSIKMYGGQMAQIGGFFGASGMSMQAICYFGSSVSPDKEIHIPVYGVDAGASASSMKVRIGAVLLSPTGNLFISESFSSYNTEYDIYVNPTTYIL